MNARPSLKTKQLLLIGLATALVSIARADYNPVALTSGSYTFDVVVESNTVQAIPYCINATSGAGTNEGDNTFYEQGLYARAGQSGGNSGIPIHNTTFAARNNANIQFLMPPTYATNNDLMVSAANNSGLTSGTFTFNTPTTATNLAILCSDGNGAMTLNYTVTHSDNSTETGTIGLLDWFTGGSTIAWGANGRITVGGTYNNFNSSSVNNNAPYLYCNNLTVSGATPIKSITFTYVSGTSTANFYAISGNAAGANWSPIPVGGFNIMSTVPAAFPLTATMDQGTNTVNNGNLATWFEQGYIQTNLSYGLPPSGSTFNSQSQPTHHYQMGNYSANNGILIDTNHQVAKITPASFAPYNAFALLTAGGNIGSGSKMTNICIMQHLDGTNETNIFIGYDWFEGSQSNFVAWVANGRVNMYNRTVNTLGAGNPKLFESYFFLGDTVSPVTNIVLRYVTAPSASSTTFILAVSATAGGIPPIIQNEPQWLNAYAGNTAKFNVTLTAGTTPVYTWQKASSPAGPFANLTDGGHVSGSATATLSLSTVSASDEAYYQVIVTNGVGAATSSPPVALYLLTSTLTNITEPADPITDTNFVNDLPSITGEGVANVIDRTTAKYFCYGSGPDAGAAPFQGPVGFVVMPQVGNTIVSAMRIYAADGNPESDPADVMLEGSIDGGNTWTTILADTALSLPDARNTLGVPLDVTNQVLEEVDFANSSGYTSYRLTVEDVKTNAVATGMQVSEIELLGLLTPIPPGIVQEPPAAKTILAGTSYPLSIVVNGPSPYHYQWYKEVGGGTNGIAGATSATYTLANAHVSDSAPYFCVVSNIYGATTSSILDLTVVATSWTYPAAVVADGPIAYWRLDEGNGNPPTAATVGQVANDYVGNHNGVYTNTEIGISPGYSAFDPDTAAGFGNAYLNTADCDVGQIAGINFSVPTSQNANFSVEAWVQNPNGAQTIAGAGIVAYGYGAGGEQFGLDCGGTSNNFRFYFRDATLGTNVFGNPAHNAAAPSSSTADGNWHHLVGVLDESHTNEYLYVDGQLAVKTLLSTNLGVQQPSTPLTIGARASGVGLNNDDQFNGIVDEVAIYPYALSATQVLNHYYAAGIAPAFILQPTNITVSQGAIATFVSSVVGTPALGLQWFVVPASGFGAITNLLANQTNAILHLADAQPDPSGPDSYFLLGTNRFGTNASALVTLTVVSGPPQIQPGGDLQASYVFSAGFPFSLSVTVDGTPPLSYGWYYDTSAVLQNGGRISGAGSNVLTVTNAQLSDSGTYQLFITNIDGTAASQIATVTVVPVLGFDGFGGGWAANGDASYTGSNVLQLTSTSGNDSSSFFDYPVYVGGFEATWTYQVVTGDGGADGACFVIQNSGQGASALGVGGGSLGVVGIFDSAELEFNIYDGNAFGGVGIALATNGVIANVTAPGAIDISSGDPIFVSLTYLNGVATLNLEDTTTTDTFSSDIPINLVSAVGGSTAYVGFTGASGAVGSEQLVSDFTFVSLVSLSAQFSSPNSIVLSWPVGVGAYVLQQTTSLVSPSWSDVGGTVTQVGGMNRETVSALGAPKYYRLHIQYTPE